MKAILPVVIGCVAAIANVAVAQSNAFLNLSARGQVDRGENVLIGGLVVEHRSNVLVRGVGPSLAPHGVVNPVPHPRLTVFDAADAAVFANTGWRTGIPAWNDANGTQIYDAAAGPDAALLSVMDQIGAFALSSDHDALFYAELDPGIYTFHLGADDDVTGIGLMEIYLVPETVDPFAPAWRVRADAATNYSPTRVGFAPLACVDEHSGRTLHLDFSSMFQWNLPVGATPATLAAAALEWTWRSTGTPDLRHGRAGTVDSRGWMTAPRYTKTAPNVAAVACLTTIDPQGTVIREEVTLTFTTAASGTFTYAWGTDDGANDRIGTVVAQSEGTFHWTRAPQLPGGIAAAPSRFFRIFPAEFADQRPAARWAVSSEDNGPVLRHGDGEDQSDLNGAREAIVTAIGGGQYVMHYDGCGALGWRACQAVSSDLLHWQKNGPVLSLGASGEDDAGAACSPWMIEAAGAWHMFYFASPNRTPAPDLVPTFPYLTRKAQAGSPLGPWIKQPAIVPFTVVPGTYYADAAAPGHVLARNGEFLLFFSATTQAAPGAIPQRTLGLARTTDLNGAWTVSAQPLLPATEQIENSSLYFEPANSLWFLFTNHVAFDAAHGEYTDAVWVYWSPDPTQWDPQRKAVVLDATSSSWSKAVIGMPTVVPVAGRLAVFYDGNDRRDFGHMRRDIGVTFLDRPLQPPSSAGW